MQIVYNHEPIPIEGSVIFLAGPTPRDPQVESWRPQALALLKEIGYEGAVIVPEDRGFTNKADFDHSAQIIWERKGLARANCVLFWVPRDLKDMPAFTTNIEFGFVSERGQAYVLGYPDSAPKMRYLAHIAYEHGAPVLHDLKESLIAAIALAERTPSPKISQDKTQGKTNDKTRHP